MLTTRGNCWALLGLVAQVTLASAHAGEGDGVYADLCVYGGTASGVVAAVTMARLGGSAVIVEPGQHLGGLTSGGLGQTDVGNAGAIGGVSREFYRRVLQHYSDEYGAESPQARASNGGFRFEPHVGEAVLNQMVAEQRVRVYVGQSLESVRVERGRVRFVKTTAGKLFRARMFIDATYEGDLMAKAGVSYTVGREPVDQYGEPHNGIQFGQPYHNFKVPVDPYNVPGDPSSGLLPGISSDDPGEHGRGDGRIQAYNFRMCLTTKPGNRRPFPKPKGYDPNRYTLLLRYIEAGVWDALQLSTALPNWKTDTNNNGGFSTDNIGMNYEWPEGDAATRRRVFDEHVTYQQGLLWFLTNDPRVPEAIRRELRHWGLARDEFTDSGGWPRQLYVREARRMVSDYVMTENDCMGRAVAPDSVGLASYTMDSHNCQRFAKDGRALNEGDVQIPVPAPFPVSYRSIIPRRGEPGNLLVPVCLSASHIAFGSIRMEPVFMVLGQSAATAAKLAIDGDTAVHDVPTDALGARLREDGQVLVWEPPTVAPLIDPRSLPGIVLDDASATRTGAWTPSNMASSRRVGTGYIHDGNADKGAKSLAYEPEVPAAGRYRLILMSVPHENRATRVPVTIEVPGQAPVMVYVDQRATADEGNALLGVFDLPAGRGLRVTVSNAGTDGYVVADGLQLLPDAE